MENDRPPVTYTRRQIFFHRMIVLGILIAVVALVIGLVVLAKSREKPEYGILVTENALDYEPRVRDFIKTNPKLKQVSEDEDPDIIIDDDEREGYDSVMLREVPPVTVRAGDKSASMGEKKSYYLLYRDGDRFVGRLQEFLQEDYPEVTLTACGDIVLGRHVAERISHRGVYYPFEKVAPYVRGSDIVFGDLECPLSDSVEPVYDGMDFVAPTSAIEGIKLCGFNVVSLANNHSTNYGRDVFEDTLELLKANDIKYVGGGEDYQEAYSPLVMEIKGVKVAFLNYNSIIGAVNAMEERAGVAGIRLLPSYDDNPDDFEMVRDSIEEVRESADVVIACFHWGSEEQYSPIESVVKMAHTAIDAGADLVIGSHPHTVQPLEYYRGKLIAYSLGNFVFDQMYTTQVREGMIMKCRFDGAQLSQVELLPYKIYDFCQPVVLNGESGQYLLDHVLEISGLAESGSEG